MAHGRISLEQALNSDNFYQLPKVIIGTKYYSKLKAEAKLLFMLCRDRLSASLDSTRKGDMRFVDADGDIFIYYAIDDLANDLGCGRDKVIKLKKELIKYGLIDEVRQGLNKANRNAKAESILQAVGLGHRMKHKPNELSGGERQRVAVARALVNDPSIILADEPTGNLDTKTSYEIMELFEEIHRKGNTVIIVTHEEDIARYAHRIIRIRDGIIERDEINENKLNPTELRKSLV